MNISTLIPTSSVSINSTLTEVREQNVNTTKPTGVPSAHPVWSPTTLSPSTHFPTFSPTSGPTKKYSFDAPDTGKYPSPTLSPTGLVSLHNATSEMNSDDVVTVILYTLFMFVMTLIFVFAVAYVIAEFREYRLKGRELVSTSEPREGESAHGRNTQIPTNTTGGSSLSERLV